MKIKRPLVIGLVLDDTLDSPDGVQQYVRTVGEWLTKRGHTVHYLVGETKRSDIPRLHSLSRNVGVSYNGNRLSIPLPADRKQLRAVLKRYNFDVLHVQVPYSPFMAGRLLRLVPADVAVVGTFHVLPYTGAVRVANRGLALLNHRSGRRFDSMIAVSQPAADFAHTAYGYDCQVVPNPFVLKRFLIKAAVSADTTVVFLGRLVERKGAGYLLAAVERLHATGRLPDNIKIIIGGKGPLQPKLETYAAAHGLSSTVQFAGFVAEDKKAAFLAQADIAVFPSSGGESFGISLLEGLAAARGIVIGGDNPGYRSVLEPLELRNLVKPRDTEVFAGLLHYWLQNTADRQQAVDRQQDYVQRFDIDTVGVQIEAAYNEALLHRRNVQ